MAVAKKTTTSPGSVTSGMTAKPTSGRGRERFPRLTSEHLREEEAQGGIGRTARDASASRKRCIDVAHGPERIVRVGRNPGAAAGARGRLL